MIAGRVALRVDPGVLGWLARGRTVLLVSGTNGKTTTSHLLAGALSAVGEVAHNASGSNMADGAVAALAARPRSRWAVLEVDELHLAEVAAVVNPAALVLLNLTRDQLDRVSEVRATADRIARVLAEQPDIVAVANADDPLAVWAASPAARRVWVAAGAGWQSDAASCPRCGELLTCREMRAREALASEPGEDERVDQPAACRGPSAPDWHCQHCALRRPRPQWWWEDGVAPGQGVAHHRLASSPLRGRPSSETFRVEVKLPGRVNLSNAVMAAAAVDAVAVDVSTALERLGEVDEVAGRYMVAQLGNHVLRLLLMKNPAGWMETVQILRPNRPILVVVNSREADGRDVSWLWDLPVAELGHRTVAVAGDRAADLGVRLSYGGVHHVADPDPLAALLHLPAGDVDVVANYTAFTALRERLLAQSPRRKSGVRTHAAASSARVDR